MMIIMKLLKIQPNLTNTKWRQRDQLMLYQFVAFKLTWLLTYQKVDSTWKSGLKKVDSNFVKIINSIQILWSDTADFIIIYTHKGDEGLYQKSAFQHKRLSRYIWVDSKKGSLGFHRIRERIIFLGIIMKLLKIQPKVTNTIQRQCDKLVLHQFVASQLTSLLIYQKVDSTWTKVLKYITAKVTSFWIHLNLLILNQNMINTYCGQCDQQVVHQFADLQL